MIDTAVSADTTIREKYDKHKEGMDLLSAGPENLAASLPSAGASDNGSNPAIQRLKQLMEDVETLKVGMCELLWIQMKYLLTIWMNVFVMTQLLYCRLRGMP